MVKKLQIYDGRKSFYQWDLNQKITSPNFKVGDEVHFTSLQQSTALIVLAYELDGKVVADVPNILLQNSYTITAYQYITVTDMGYTIDEQLFKVIKRPQPDDYVYTETEIYTIKTVVDKALLEAKESGEFDGKDGKDGVDGKDGEKGEKGDDYVLTESDKEEIAELVAQTEIGDIDTALDNIIAIQNSLIGGDSNEYSR